MYGLSKFVLKKKSQLVFQEKNCSENGGALYVSAPGTPFVSISVTDGSIHKCFFVYEDPERAPEASLSQLLKLRINREDLS